LLNFFENVIVENYWERNRKEILFLSNCIFEGSKVVIERVKADELNKENIKGLDFELT